MRTFIAISTVALCLCVAVSTAEARFILTIDDTSETSIDPDTMTDIEAIVIDDVDGSVGDHVAGKGYANKADMSAGDGKLALGFFGTVGDFEVEIILAKSKPTVSSLAGQPDPPRITLTADVRYLGSGAPATLEIMITDTDFEKVEPSVEIIGEFSGTFDDQIITYQGFVDVDNEEFGMTGPSVFSTPIVTLGTPPLDTSGDGTRVSSPIPPEDFVGPFSISNLITVTHPSNSTTSTSGFSAQTTVTPEPLSLGVWAGLVACFGVGGYWARRRRRMNG